MIIVLTKYMGVEFLAEFMPITHDSIHGPNFMKKVEHMFMDVNFLAEIMPFTHCGIHDPIPFS